LIQDPSRVIRNAALKLLCTVTAKESFGIISESVTSLLESTYQYHEYCLRVCSLAVLHFVSETQITAIDKNLFRVFEHSLMTLASCAASIIVFSSEQIVKNSSTRHIESHSSRRSVDSSDSDDGVTPRSKRGPKDSSTSFSTYEASVDLFSLTCVAKSIIDSLTTSSFSGISTIRNNSSVQVIDALLASIRAPKFSYSISNDITQRIKSFQFPSLSDEVIHDLSDKIIADIEHAENKQKKLKRDKSLGSTNNNELVLKKEPSRSRFEEISTKIAVEEKKVPPFSSLTPRGGPREISFEAITTNPQYLSSKEATSVSDANQQFSPSRSPRRSLLKSHSNKRHPELNEMSTPERGAFSAPDGDSRMINSNPLSFQFEALSIVRPTEKKNGNENHNDEESAPTTPVPCQTPNGSSGYSRAANARAKRTKLKGGQIIETSMSMEEKSNQQQNAGLHHGGQSQPGIVNVSSSSSLKGLLNHSNDQDTVPVLRKFSPSKSKSNSHDENEVGDDDEDEQSHASSRVPRKSPRRISRASSHAKSINSSFDGSHLGNDFALNLIGTNSRMNSPRANRSQANSRTNSPRAHPTPGKDAVHLINAAMKSDAFDYLDSADIQPIAKNPTQEFQKAVKALENLEWPEIFNTLNTMRSVVLHHPHIIMKSGLLHSIIMLIIKQVENLRSSLSKNAILTIMDCFIGLGKNIDMEINSILPSLLKRSADTSNNFLSEVSDRALEKMVECISIHRSLSSFLTSVENSKSAILRAKATYFLYYLAKSHCKEFPLHNKEYDVLKAKIGKLLQDSSPETRLTARNIVKVLLLNNVITKDELENNRISSDQIDKCLQEKSLPVAGVTSGGEGNSTPGGNLTNGLFTPKGSHNSMGFRHLMNDVNSGGNPDTHDWLVGEEMSDMSMYSAQKGMKAASPMRPTRNNNNNNHQHKATDSAILRTPPRSAARSSNEMGSSNYEPSDSSATKRKLRLASPNSAAYRDSPPLSNQNHQTHHNNKTGGIATKSNSFDSSNLRADSHELSLSPDGSDSFTPIIATNRKQSLQNQGTATPKPLRSPRSSSINQKGGAPTPAAAKRIMESDPQLMQWQTMIMTISTSKNWNEKKDALTFMTDLILKHSSILKDVGKLESSLDCVLDRLADGSLKIISHTMDCFEKILSTNENIILQCNILQFVLPKLFNVVISSNR
jgi:hypothetical protein